MVTSRSQAGLSTHSFFNRSFIGIFKEYIKNQAKQGKDVIMLPSSVNIFLITTFGRPQKKIRCPILEAHPLSQGRESGSLY